MFKYFEKLFSVRFPGYTSIDDYYKTFGIKKFAYEIWGDTVNFASRMQSSGEAGKANLSESTFKLINLKFTCAFRGKILAKHKGEVDIYFVENVLNELVIV